MIKKNQRNLKKLAARHPARILPRRGEKCPAGYTTRYEWSDSDYAERRHKVFVRKAKKK